MDYFAKKLIIRRSYNDFFVFLHAMKYAIIMGASSGMGHEVSLRLLAEGWHIGVAARHVDELEKLEMLYSGKVVTMQIDITSDNAPQKLLQLVNRLGGMDLYFHSSGIGKQNMLLDETIESNTVTTNALGFTRMVNTAFHYMEQHQGGHIVAISSIAGVKGLGAAPSYSATKAFQNIYIQALEQQANMRNLNISFTDIRPGFVDTPLLNDGKRYPMLMDTKKVVDEIMKAIHHKRHTRIIDWRYRILVPLWQMIPNGLWRRVRIRR